MGDKIKRKKTRRLGEEMPEKDLCGHRGNDETQTYEIRSNKEIPPPRQELFRESDIRKRRFDARHRGDSRRVA